VHVNIKWDFGPFCWVLASPVYHRWHHTDVARGGSKNFAATFPIFDLMFGTYYMPRGVLPDGYGVDDPDFPKTFGAQLLYPFRSKAPEVESSREVAAVAK
jgi:sterol desaturase/sphingolipid hydroxylase (fatty acid hydroxylase superfamily)